ncbi:MAG: hypothetical protein ACLP7Q_14325 [Isosphaeraceae bacterium]
MRTLLAALLIATAVGMTAYWVDFFTRGAVHAIEEDWYIRFEKAFPIADGWIAVCCLAAAVGLLGGQPSGELFAALASGSLIYLALLDIMFNLQNGLYRLLPRSAAMWGEVVINAWTLLLGIGSALYLASRSPGARGSGGPMNPAGPTRPVLAYVQRAGIQDDKEGPLFRPMTPDVTQLIRRHLDRKTPLVAGEEVLSGGRNRP